METPDVRIHLLVVTHNLVRITATNGSQIGIDLKSGSVRTITLPLHPFSRKCDRDPLSLP